MQFAEGLSDSQAADAVRSRIDWKYLLGLDLTDSGFDSSVLSEFRNRLCEQGLANKLLDLMLLRFQEACALNLSRFFASSNHRAKCNLLKQMPTRAKPRCRNSLRRVHCFKD
jgi:transposase